MSSIRKLSFSLLLALLIAAPAVFGDIVNGGFETGDFSGWTIGGTSANGQVLQASDLPGSGLTPPEGKYFALLSTGPGAIGIEETTTLTSIPYLVGANAEIGFQLDFLTAQPSADVPNNDFFEFNILGNPNFTGESGDVFSDEAAGSLKLIVPGSYVVAPDGTALTYHTGFNQLFVDISGYQGQTVRFQFLVSPALAAQENFADTALLIDSVSAPEVTAIPEPTMTVPFIAILAALIVCVRRRREPSTR